MSIYSQFIDNIRTTLDPFVPGITDAQISQLVIFLIVSVLVLLITGLVVQIMYLLTLSRAIKKCSPSNQAMSPSLVWLEMIPGFNFIWRFFNVINVSESLGKEFRCRGMDEPESPAKTTGLLYCIFSCGGVIPFMGSLLVFVGAPIFWTIFWTKVSRFSRKLDVPVHQSTSTAM